MTGLIKQKQYDWKDSNLALFGSDTDRQVKKESAETEPAWKKAGEKVGIQIWRIVKFKVTHWPKEDYGKFYDGDSYIILNTFQEEGGEEFLYDVHFWIGKYSTQDEYGTAAYKTVELDTLLDDKPIQHREVQDHESELFKSYFKTITSWHPMAAQYLVELRSERSGKAKAEVLEEGEVDDEFSRSLDGGEEEDFSMSSIEQSAKEETKLFRVSDATGSLDMKLEKSGSINKGDFDTNDVFLYDTSDCLFVWIGKKSSPAEKKNAMTYAHKYLMKSTHPLVPITCLAEGRRHGEFDTALAA
ncbi:gelsolin-like protein 1 [Mizuhopecten yessoensis]|uniref:gelsolin-like protein 1 n=1 Tax=Mizuhopecten yessoensis TaxID=6573 RepID=UPI000B45B1A7|nr:gelsolin-like protein 1 [Mizuhopecten yessoensis]